MGSWGIVGGGERQIRVERRDFFLHLLIGPWKPFLENRGKAWFEPTVHTETGLGNKASPFLVASTRPRVEAAKLILNGPFQGRVIANLKVKMVDFYIASPIAAPELISIVYTE